MSKRKKKKAPVVEGELEVEIITKVEYIYEDTKATTEVEPDYKWEKIYRMIANQNVPAAGFIKLNKLHSLSYKLTKENKLTNYTMRRLQLPPKKEKSLR